MRAIMFANNKDEEDVIMLNEDQVKVIREFVPETYFDQERLIKYLNIHNMVGIEVFEYVAKEVFTHSRQKTAVPVTLIDGYPGTNYEPESVEVFVRRIPFNFYIEGEPTYKDENGKEHENWRTTEIAEVLYCVGNEPGTALHNHRSEPLSLEDAYKKLEFLYYDCGYSLKEIFSYTHGDGWCDFDDAYADWFDYLDMCFELGWEDYMPTQFYYKYNLAREALGKDPVIFYIQEIDCEAWQRGGSDAVEYYERKGNKLSFIGVFPVDETDAPVLRWIGVDIKNAASITSEHRDEDSYLFHITVELTPRTVIHALIPAEHDEIGNPIKAAGMKWLQIYAGPQMMSFNYKVIKERRKKLGYTQQQVAEAVQTNVRTYQKWENGETTPDGYYLLRILNWLDIPKISNVIIYESEK